ncbi:hypothetical protein PENTCL1PPCAC_7791, partial [Pristionchus entomophagus]
MGRLGASGGRGVDTVTHWGYGSHHLLDLDAGELDVSLDLESGDVVGVGAVSEGGETLAVHKDLEGVGLVGDGQIEAHSLLEGVLALALLIAPLVLLEGVANHDLLVATGVEVEGDVAVLAEKVDVESLSLLLDGSEDEEGLADGEAVGDSALVGNGVVLSSPVDVVQVEVSIDGEMRDGGEGESVLEVTELLLVDDDLESVVVGADADVEGVSLLEGVRLALLLAPLAVVEGVHDDLALIEAEGDVERDIVAGEIGRLGVEVDGEALALIDRGSLDDQGLSGLDLLLEQRAVGHGVGLDLSHLDRSVVEKLV